MAVPRSPMERAGTAPPPGPADGTDVLRLNVPESPQR